MKTFDFIRQVFKGKSIYRILFNWQVQEHCQDLNGKCLDLAGGKNPSYHRYWSFKNDTELIKTDLNGGLKVDLNKDLPFDDNSMDNVFFFNAIYIIKEPEKLIKEIHRVLKPEGNLFIASPFIFNEAKEPSDYRRLTSQGLEELLKQGGFNDFKIIPFGERFTAGVHLWHSFFLFNFIRLIAFTKAMVFDKWIPRKIKKFHPCPLGYFIIIKKT